MSSGDRWETGSLSVSEQALVDAAANGKRAILNGAIVRSELIEAIATNRFPEFDLPPVGLSVYDAVIEGCLDLEGCVVDKPLVFLRCTFDAKGASAGAIRLRDASIKRIGLYECRVEGSIKADRMRVESAVFLSSSTINGAVRLRGARLGEALALDKVVLQNPGEIALLADGMRLDGPMLLRTADVTGEVRLAGAHIGGNLLWEEARIANAGVAINGEGLVCDGAWVLRRARVEGSVRIRGVRANALDAPNIEILATNEGLNARGAEIGGDFILDGSKISGGIRLNSSQIAGEFNARGATLSGPGEEWAVSVSGATINRGMSVSGAKIVGGISLSGADIGSGFGASSVEIQSSGRAIEADVMQLRGNWIMRGAQIAGSLRFAGARIQGQLGFTGSSIVGSGDLAIRADGVHVGGGWFMGRSTIQGIVRLPAAQLGNEMRLRSTKIKVDYGPALFANGVKIARELVLDGGFETTGGVVLDHAQIDGMVDLEGSRVVSAVIARDGRDISPIGDDVLIERYDEVALSFVDARIDRLVMPASPETRPRGIVDLSRARVGSYEDVAAAWPPSAAQRKSDVRYRLPDGRDVDHLVLDGFNYEHLENPAGLVRGSEGRSTSNVRIRWLDGQSEQDLVTHFKPQAWVQLSRRLAAQGYHDDAREIAILRRRRHRRAASASKSARIQGWLLDVFALYGFNPWRTVVWAIAFIMLFAGVWHYAATGCLRSDCKDETVFVMALKGEFGQDDAKAVTNYPAFVPIAYSLDVFMPFVNFGFKEHWRPRLDYAPLARIAVPIPDAHRTIVITTGQVLYVLYVIEMLLGLILISLAITGFTGMLKGEEEGR